MFINLITYLIQNQFLFISKRLLLYLRQLLRAEVYFVVFSSTVVLSVIVLGTNNAVLLPVFFYCERPLKRSIVTFVKLFSCYAIASCSYDWHRDTGTFLKGLSVTYPMLTFVHYLRDIARITIPAKLNGR